MHYNRFLEKIITTSSLVGYVIKTKIFTFEIIRFKNDKYFVINGEDVFKFTEQQLLNHFVDNLITEIVKPDGVVVKFGNNGRIDNLNFDYYSDDNTIWFRQYNINSDVIIHDNGDVRIEKCDGRDFSDDDERCKIPREKFIEIFNERKNLISKFILEQILNIL